MRLSAALAMAALSGPTLSGPLPSRSYVPFVVFSTHGTPKYLSSSARRPGTGTGNAGSLCTKEQANAHVTFSRNRKRRVEFTTAMAEINTKAGGEKRRVRRSMARDLAKRMGEARA